MFYQRAVKQTEADFCSRTWDNDGQMRPDVITIRGPKAGKTVAIFAGVHGNERAGIRAVQELGKTLTITSGVAHLVLANPRAIAKGVRYCDKNLNRCFLKDNSGQTYEDELARTLMPLLDESDALLDLHSYSGPEDQPFLIGEANCFELASYLNFPIISNGWSTNEPGSTDGYMYTQGKIGLCAECGSNFRSEEYVSLALQTVEAFLWFFGLTARPTNPERFPQRLVTVLRAEHKHTAGFAFTKEYTNFEELPEGEIFAVDGPTEYRAGPKECIIFPRPNAAIGDEAFLIGSVTE